MDKLEIKQGSFIQQTQYFIPVEIDVSVVPARLGISDFSLVLSDNRNTRSTCPTSVLTGIGQTLMSRPDKLFEMVMGETFLSYYVNILLNKHPVSE